MSVIDELLESVSEVCALKAQVEFEQILAPEERIEQVYQLTLDMFLFTDRRLIFVNNDGITGSELDYQSILY